MHCSNQLIPYFHFASDTKTGFQTSVPWVGHRVLSKRSHSYVEIGRDIWIKIDRSYYPAYSAIFSPNLLDFLLWVAT